MDMKHIKKFNEKKREKKSSKEEEFGFSAKSLEKDKEEVIGLGIKTEPVEHDEKELKDIKKNKVEKFESFITINIDNVENMECDNEFEVGSHEEEDSYDDEDAEYEEDGGCGCCDECTGEEGCYCGCEDCKCGTEEDVNKASDVISLVMSENLKYHLRNNKPITESIFRPGSESFFNVLKEARELYDAGKIELCSIDESIYRETEIGKFGRFNGKIVPLDLPMESIEEVNEAKYGKKKVELNHPMRNTGPGKKYYVYVKNPKTGKIKKVTFGDVKGGLTAKVSDPEARKSFAARHKCSTKKDKTKAGYWSCRLNKYGHLFGGKTYPGYW